MNLVLPSRIAAETRYRDIRLAAHKAAETIVREEWAGHPNRRYPWPWQAMLDNLRKNEPDRFELALWSENTLCGLAVGSTRRSFCRVDYLEGSPEPDHPLKGYVAMIMVGAVVAYATALNRPEVRLCDPIPVMTRKYQSLGFSLVTPRGEAPYCAWKVI